MSADEPVLTMTLTTRGYELGPAGVIPLSGYLRYLEHQRWQTLTSESELPVRRFWGLGVVRAQTLQLFRQTSFHVELELSLWIARVGRTSFDFGHRIVRKEDGALVALSTATVVALDENRRPRPISEEAHQYVLERPRPEVGRPTGEAPEGCWEQAVPIRPSDHDLQQHVNHARYVDYVEDVRVLCARAGGYGEGDWEEAPTGLSIEYVREARLGDALVARSFRAPGAQRAVEVELRRGPGDVVTRARVELGRRGG